MVGEDSTGAGHFPSGVSGLTYLPSPKKVEFFFCLLQTK